ncbi:uncharacterized protein LOC124925206 [Impatiens glandulifera]|uniref:uncharacterized protein LOC124925206 n=1 Tax=Impatiens glandulifera TaxID=253017 RepID=UPI001FB16B7B|nr:uncharacterized protein LOC124925206 [Impatiens glandulifera]
MEEKRVPPPGKSSGIPKSIPRPKSTFPVKKRRIVKDEGISESERKRPKLQDFRPLHQSKVVKAVNSNVKASTGGELRCKSGSLENIDSMKVWKELKENGFLSTNLSDKLKLITKIAKNEKFVRPAKIVPPSGLLSGLNPGILRHGIRNRKDVHSIIRSFIQSPKQEESKTVTDNQTSPSMLPVHVSLLPVKAANVASQWLDFIHQNTKGRLAALQESKNRVRAAYQNHIGPLLSKEFWNSNKLLSASDEKNYHAHGVKWTARFLLIKESISDEERNLVSVSFFYNNNNDYGLNWFFKFYFRQHG